MIKAGVCFINKTSFVNKVLLELSGAHLVTFYLWLLSSHAGRVGDPRPAKPQLLVICPSTPDV